MAPSKSFLRTYSCCFIVLFASFMLISCATKQPIDLRKLIPDVRIDVTKLKEARQDAAKARDQSSPQTLKRALEREEQATDKLEQSETDIDVAWDQTIGECNAKKEEILRGSLTYRAWQAGLSILGLVSAGLVPVLNTASVANIVWSSAMGALSGVSQGTLEATRRLGIDTLLEVQRYNGLVNKIDELYIERATAILEDDVVKRVQLKARLNLLLEGACNNPPVATPQGLSGDTLNELLQAVREQKKEIQEQKEEIEKLKNEKRSDDA